MQRHTIKLVLKSNKKNALNQLPIYVRLTVDRKSSFLSTGYYILRHHWDERNEMVRESHPLHLQINADIINKKRELLNQVVSAGIKGKAVTVAAIKRRTAHTLFHSFADEYIRELTTKRAKGTLDNYSKHLKRFKQFSGDITFEEITPEYLNAFELWLLENTNTRGEDSLNYAHAVLKTIRRMFTEARRRGITEAYPFAVYEMPEYKSEGKQWLSLKELDRWHKYAGETKSEAAIWFLFGCYTGLRVSDWYKFKQSHIHKDYLSLRAKKNFGRVAIPIHKRLSAVMELIKEVPIVTREILINRELKHIANRLHIDKRISTHSARRTFAITMCAERGVSCETCAELMGISIKTCRDAYYSVTPEKIRKETAAAWRGL